MDELLQFKSSVDQDNKSVYYKRFYRESEIFNSQHEIDQLNNRLHLLHSMYEKEGQGIVTIGQVSRLKITEVFDSTATATIYKPRNPHISIDVGDYIKF